MARDPKFGEDVTNWLYSHGYSQRVGAEVLGVSQRTLEGWCAGRFSPSAAGLYRQLMSQHDADRAGDQ